MRVAAVLLTVLGLAQMFGDLAGLPLLRGLALATTASPAPKVFSAVAGFETYSTRFFLEWTERGGALESLELTPEVYARMRGPYNRRNVFGAVVAYGPVLVASDTMRPAYEAVASYALCGDAPLLRELGVEPDDVEGPPRIRLEPLPGSDLGDLTRELTAPCVQ